MSARLSAIGPARQAFETPEGDYAGLAAVLADKLFVTEHEASTLEREGGRGPPALRTDQREISCAPAQNEMSQPVHVVLFRLFRPFRASARAASKHPPSIVAAHATGEKYGTRALA